MSVSNPDLALYEGDSDEVFDADGKRKERSVYGRKWIANPSGEVKVTIELDGRWEIEDSADSRINLEPKENSTVLKIITNECKTEKFTLRKQ